MKTVPLLLLFAVGPLLGDGLTDLRRSCWRSSLVTHPTYWLAECVQELFSTDPVHLTVGTIAPGAGIFAFGLGAGQPLRFGQSEFIASGSAVASTDGSFLLRGALTFALPTRGFTEIATATARYGTNNRWPLAEVAALDAKASLTLTASRLEAKEQDFYGLGNTTDRSARSGYSLRLNDAGVAWNNPLFSWTSIGVTADFLQPRIGMSTNTGIPQVLSQFNEATAPALAAYTDFLTVQPNLRIQVPPYRSTYFAMDIGYGFYHSIQDAARYSFRRLGADARVVYPLHVHTLRRAIFDQIEAGKPVKVVRIPAGRWIREAICWTGHGDYCSLGDVSVFSRVDYSFSGIGSSVPFYLQPTLGGTDFQGNDTLRGYADYRFRAPNRMYGQLEYRHPVWGPIGLLGFYDVGKVGLEPSDLSLDHLRHDWGVGLYARIRNREIARIYLGFGTREGTQLHPKMGSLF